MKTALYTTTLTPLPGVPTARDGMTREEGKRNGSSRRGGEESRSGQQKKREGEDAVTSRRGCGYVEERMRLRRREGVIMSKRDRQDLESKPKADERHVLRSETMPVSSAQKLQEDENVARK